MATAHMSQEQLKLAELATREDIQLFSYEPLQSTHHIRCLSIRDLDGLPANNSLSFLLDHYDIVQLNLNEKPKFHALSYAWGESEKTHTINISGTHHLKVTKSLVTALPYVVQTCTTNLLWIDQICIDQSNVLEKNQQVGLMEDIYSKAEEVIIWTGEEIEGLQEMTHREWAVDGFSEPNFSVLYQLLTRPWFRRSWIVQEVVLAQKATFLAGSCQIPSLSLIQAWQQTPVMIRTFKEFKNLTPQLIY
jgi:hypothetical protein